MNQQSVWSEINILPPENKSNIRLIATRNYQELCSVMAEHVQKQIKEKPDSRLALPAGNTPRGCYELLGRASQNKELDWRQIKSFALDDYLDADETHTFQHFFETQLYRFTNLPSAGKFNPRFVDNYDQLIADCGGIDLCMLGLGVNGHIAFNEPPTCAASWTHCVFLTETTRKINSRDFADKIVSADSVSPAGAHAAPLQGPGITNSVDLVPKRAISMGIATILASKRIILAVSGEQKTGPDTRLE